MLVCFRYVRKTLANERIRESIQVLQNSTYPTAGYTDRIGPALRVNLSRILRN
jgi:hypothetical protein